MKKIIIFTLLVTGLLISCSSDSNSNEGFATYMRFTMNGQYFDVPNPSTDATGSSGSIMAPGFFGDEPDQIFVIDMPFLPTIGEHPFVLYTSEPGIYAANFQMSPGTSFESESGSIKITSVGNDFVKGTFSFTGTSNGTTYTVTNGKFRSFRAEQLVGRGISVK
jgi:hypothetical protein